MNKDCDIIYTTLYREMLNKFNAFIKLKIEICHN